MLLAGRKVRSRILRSESHLEASCKLAGSEVVMRNARSKTSRPHGPMKASPRRSTRDRQGGDCAIIIDLPED